MATRSRTTVRRPAPPKAPAPVAPVAPGAPDPNRRMFPGPEAYEAPAVPAAPAGPTPQVMPPAPFDPAHNFDFFNPKPPAAVTPLPTAASISAGQVPGNVQIGSTYMPLQDWTQVERSMLEEAMAREGLDIYGRPLQQAPAAPGTRSPQGATLAAAGLDFGLGLLQSAIANAALPPVPESTEQIAGQFNDLATQAVVPTPTQLGDVGLQATIDQYGQDVETYARGQGDLNATNQQLDELRATGGEILDQYDQEAADAEARYNDLRGMIDQVHVDGTGNLQTALDAARELNQMGIDYAKQMPDIVAAAGRDSVQAISTTMDRQFEDTMGSVRQELDSALNLISGKLGQSAAEDRARVAELMQTVGASINQNVQQNITELNNDPRFREMSADQRSMAIGTIKLKGAAEAGNTLAQVHAAENNRMAANQVERDKILSDFRGILSGQFVESATGMTRERWNQLRAASDVALGEFGATVRQAGVTVADLAKARGEMEQQLAKDINDWELTTAELATNAENDYRDWRGRALQSKGEFDLGMNQLWLQGSMDAFNMGQSLAQPSLMAGLSDLLGSLFNLNVGILDKAFQTDQAKYAMETGRVSTILQPTMAGIQGANETYSNFFARPEGPSDVDKALAFGGPLVSSVGGAFAGSAADALFAG